MPKFMVRVETRSKETFIIEAADEKEAEDIGIEMSDGGMNGEVWDSRAEPYDGTQEAENF